MCLAGSADLAVRAADATGASAATVAVLKAAAPAANTQTSPDIVGPTKTPGFEMSMRSASVFDAIAAEALPAPFHTRLALVAGAMTAGEVAEGAGKVCGLVSFASNGLDPVKCAGCIAVTKQLLEGAPGALEAFQRELQAAVAAAADTAFLADIQAGNSDTAQGAASGSLAAITEDVVELLRMVHVGSRSNCFWLSALRKPARWQRLRFNPGLMALRRKAAALWGCVFW